MFTKREWNKILPDYKQRKPQMAMGENYEQWRNDTLHKLNGQNQVANLKAAGELSCIAMEAKI